MIAYTYDPSTQDEVGLGYKEPIAKTKLDVVLCIHDPSTRKWRQRSQFKTWAVTAPLQRKGQKEQDEPLGASPKAVLLGCPSSFLFVCLFVLIFIHLCFMCMGI